MIRALDKILMLGVVLMLTHTAARADLIGPGDVAFIGWNSDTADAFAFVVLADVEPNTTLFLTDRTWDGSAFTGTEGTVTWTSPSSSLAAGQVVSVTNAENSGSIAVNQGSVSRSGNFALSGSNEQTFAYLGSANSPTAFLSAFANDASTINLLNTGLSDGTTAQVFSGAFTDHDIFAYNGTRFTAGPFSDFLTLIGNDSNWVSQNGNGNQADDGTAPDLPFDTTAFAAPEPSTLLMTIVALSGFGLLRLRRQNRFSDRGDSDR